MTPTPDRHLIHPKYRADIDGLRAIAVIAVVVFHAFPGLARGGFVGVDIFFVISGYLISTILFSSLERGRFSFTEFYGRRIRRIFPALLVVLIASFAFGWFALFADEYEQFGKHAAAGAGFVSNFTLWNESGYFDNAADTKPLLHLWSLGIEEQFYITWPVLLWATWRARINLLAVTLLVGSVSFLLNITVVQQDVVGAFYSPWTRAWELLVGATLAHAAVFGRPAVRWNGADSSRGHGAETAAPTLEARGRGLRNAQSILGTLLIAVGVLAFTSETPFPGWWALLPTLGTALVISAGADAWVNRAVLSRRVLVWFGLISFPLYMWHWPLLSFARIVEGESSALTLRIALVAVSVALAWLTLALIERPLRAGGHAKAKTAALCCLMALIGLGGYFTHVRDGLPFRMRREAEFLEYFENKRPEMRYFERTGMLATWRPECAFFDLEKYRAGTLAGQPADSKPRDSIDKSCFERDTVHARAVLLWGDSHAQALSPGLQAGLPPDWQLLQVASSGCVPSTRETEPSDVSQCKQSNYLAMRAIATARPDVVVIAQDEAHQAARLAAIADELNSLGVKKVIIVGPTPHWKSSLPTLLARTRLLADPRRRLKAGLREDVLALDRTLAAALLPSESRTYASIIGVLCDEEGCLTYLGDEPRSGITTWDGGHLTPIASDFVASRLLVDMIVNGD